MISFLLSSFNPTALNKGKKVKKYIYISQEPKENFLRGFLIFSGGTERDQ